MRADLPKITKVSHLQIAKVLGSGSALQRNPVLQKCTESVFGVPLTIVDGVDAPKGAAIAVKILTMSCT